MFVVIDWLDYAFTTRQTTNMLRHERNVIRGGVQGSDTSMQAGGPIHYMVIIEADVRHTFLPKTRTIPSVKVVLPEPLSPQTATISGLLTACNTFHELPLSIFSDQSIQYPQYTATTLSQRMLRLHLSEHQFQKRRPYHQSFDMECLLKYSKEKGLSPIGILNM